MYKIFALLFFPICLIAQVSFDGEMTKEQMQATGVEKLNATEKRALETWIDDNYESKENRLPKNEKQLYLSLNVDNGAKLELSDGTTYAIAPEDQLYSSYWITPFPVMVSKGDHPEYPIKITNLNTKTSVNAKRIAKEQLLQQPEQEVQQTYPQQVPSPKRDPELKPKPKPKSKPEPKPKPETKKK